MKQKTNWLLVVLGGVGYTALIGASYVANLQYVLFQAATGFSDAEIGAIVGVVGSVALVGYLFGGVLSDFMKTKTLMVLSHFAVPVLLFFLLGMPNHRTFMIIEFGLAFFSIFTYWTPMAKFVSDLGAPEDEGKRYGFFFMASSITGFLVGLVAAYFIRHFDAVVALRNVFLVYMGLNIITGLAIIFSYKEQAVEGEASLDDKFQLKYVWQALKMPAIWLIGIMGFAAYGTGKAMVYLTPYLQDCFGLPLETVQILSSVSAYGIAIFMSPVAGMLTDKMKSATKLLRIMLVGFIITCVAVYLVPVQASFSWVLIVCLCLGAAFYAVDQANWFTPLSEISFPSQVRGTVIGIVSVLEFSGDAFLYNVYGNMLENNGLEAGYKMIYMNIGIIAVVGLLAGVILKKYTRKDNA